MTSPATNDELKDILSKLNELIKDRNRLVELLEYFPTKQTIDTAKIIAKLITLLASVRKEFWEALYEFLRCNTQYLSSLQLTKEELKKIHELIKNTLELYMVNAGVITESGV